MSLRVLLLAAMAPALMAQASAQPDFQAQVEAQIQLLRADLARESRQTVAANLPLSAEESRAFWPIYEKYALAQSQLMDRRFEQLRRYAGKYDDMDNATALALEREAFAIQKENLNLVHKYFAKFSGAIGPVKAGRWAQLENTIRSVRELQAMAGIPLLKVE